MEKIQLFVPNYLITAAEERYNRIKLDGAVPEFRKMVILITLVVPVNYGHFTIKTNNTRGSNLNWIFKHNCPKSQKPKCTRQAKVESLQENQISITISGSCHCKSQHTDDVIQSKLSYIQYWQSEDSWIPSNLLMLNEDEVDEDEAAVMCCFGGGEEESATATVSTAPTNRGDVQDGVRGTEQTVTIEEFRLELGGNFEALLGYIKTLFLNIIYTRTTTTTRF